DGDARGVVAAVLEALQAFDDYRDDVAPRDGADDSAHGFRAPCFQYRSAPAAPAASAPARKSKSCAERAGMKACRSSPARPRAIAPATTSIGRRPSVAIQSITVSDAYASTWTTVSIGSRSSNGSEASTRS